MSDRKRTFMFRLIALAAVLLAFVGYLAPAALSLPWGTVDGGGGGGCYSSGTGLTVCGAAGQADASAQVLQSGNFKLNSGFWSGPYLVRYQIYAPVVRR